MFEMAHLHEDALREYDELELCYLETGAQRLVFFSVALVKMMFRFDLTVLCVRRLYGTLDIQSDLWSMEISSKFQYVLI